nr:MAG TPA: hypothetical protein [Crassvirales sp.]
MLRYNTICIKKHCVRYDVNFYTATYFSRPWFTCCSLRVHHDKIILVQHKGLQLVYTRVGVLMCHSPLYKLVFHANHVFRPTF